MDTRKPDHNKKEKIFAEERIGQVEFLKRLAIIETIKSPFFNQQLFTEGQEEQQEKNHAPSP